MHMSALRDLHRDMRRLQLDMQQFQVRIGAAEFDCLFSIRENPFVLSLTSRGLNPIFVKFDVHPGYQIKEYFGDLYSNLCRALYVDGRSGAKLIPADFLKRLNAMVPTAAAQHAVPTREEIVRLRHDLEERDKPYFESWVYWKDGRGPSIKNKHKTLTVLGSDALDFSIHNRASARWSPTSTNIARYPLEQIQATRKGPKISPIRPSKI